MEKFSEELIAPCGMNCGVCRAYLRDKNHCSGCNFNPTLTSCLKCKIRNCDKRKGNFCSPDCDEFPCKRLKDLDKRYSEKYDMSEIENLECIRDNGIDKFIDRQEKKYISSRGIFCVHDKEIHQIKD